MKNSESFDLILFDDNYDFPIIFPYIIIEDIDNNKIKNNDIIGSFMKCKTKEDIEATLSVLTSQGINFDFNSIKKIFNNNSIDSENVIIVNSSDKNRYCKISGMDNPNENNIETRAHGFNYIQYGGEVDFIKTYNQKSFKDYSVTFDKDNDIIGNHQISIIIGMFKENNKMGFYEITGSSFSSSYEEQDFYDSDILMSQLRNHYKKEMDTNAPYFIANVAKDIFNVRTMKEINSDFLNIENAQLKINMNDFKHLNPNNNKDRTQSDFLDIQLIVIDNFFLDRVNVSIIDYENNEEKHMKPYEDGASVLRLTNGHLNYWSFNYHNLIQIENNASNLSKEPKIKIDYFSKYFDISSEPKTNETKINKKIIENSNNKEPKDLEKESVDDELDVGYINDVFSDLEEIRKKLSEQGLNFKFTIDNS